MMTAIKPDAERMALAEAIKSGDLAIIFCHPQGLGAIDASQDQRDLIEAALRSQASPATREAMAKAIRCALVENWKNAVDGSNWDEDVLLTGCKKVGGGFGYQNPNEAAENLTLDAADAILSLQQEQQADKGAPVAWQQQLTNFRGRTYWCNLPEDWTLSDGGVEGCTYRALYANPAPAAEVRDEELARKLAYETWPHATDAERQSFAENKWPFFLRSARVLLSTYRVLKPEQPQ